MSKTKRASYLELQGAPHPDALEERLPSLLSGSLRPQEPATGPPGTPDGSLGPQQPVAIPPNAVWIDAVQVRRLYGGRSEMWLHRKIQNDPEFPEPTYIGRLRFWKVAELAAYDRVCEARTRARSEQHRNV